MRYSREKITGDVRTALNVNRRRNGPLEAHDIETLTLDQRIEAEIPDAIRTIEQAADSRLFDSSPTLATADALQRDRLGRAWISLPADFMRLVAIRLEGWNRDVTELTDTGSALWMLAMSEGGEVVANADTPLAAIERGPGGAVMRLAGEGGNRISTALYRREPGWDRQGTIEISAPLYDATIRLTAERIGHSGG